MSTSLLRCGLAVTLLLLASCAARERLRELVQTPYEEVRASAERAGALAEEGRFEDALDLMAPHAEVEDPRVRFLDRFTRAWLYETWARTAVPDSAEARARLGEAAALYLEILEAHPRHPETSQNLAEVRRRQGRRAEAIALLRAVPEDPAQPEAHYRRLIGVGDLWTERAENGPRADQLANLRQALESFDEAHAHSPGDETAPWRILDTYDRFAPALAGLEEGWAASLLARARGFEPEGASTSRMAGEGSPGAAERAGSPTAARVGYEMVLRASLGDEANQEQEASGLEALAAWVDLEIDRLGPTRESIATLPPGDGQGTQLERALAELQLLTRDPRAALASTEPQTRITWWRGEDEDGESTDPEAESTEGPDAANAADAAAEEAERGERLVRKQRLARVLRARATRLALTYDPEQVQEAAQIFDLARVEAPGYDDYAHEVLRDEPLVRLNVALDLALLRQDQFDVEHDEEIRQSLDAMLNELRDEMLRPPAEQSDPFLRLELRDVFESRKPTLLRIHRVMGLIYVEQGKWFDDDPWRTAPFHLQRAITVANSMVPPRPEPELGRILADGLRFHERYQLAFQAYSKAAADYMGVQPPDIDGAEEMYRRAREVIGLMRGHLDDGIGALESSLDLPTGGFFPDYWVEPGWYVGGQIGAVSLDASEADLERSILNETGEVVSVDFDDPASGYKFFGGYQWENPVAVEFGYVNLGTVGSRITPQGGFANVAAIQASAVQNHPRTGQGLAVALKGNLFGADVGLARITGTAHVGAWGWQVEGQVMVEGGTVRHLDTEGVDPYWGLGLMARLSRSLYGRVEFEQYYIDGEAIDMLGIGLQVMLPDH